MMFQFQKSYGLFLYLVSFMILTSTEYTLGQVRRSQILGAYAYNFAQLSSSEVKNKQKTYNIVLLSPDKNVIEEFEILARDKDIDGKPIKVSVANTEKFSLKGVCMVFVTKEMNHRYEKVFKNTKGTDILLVSENYPDKLKVLLNLHPGEVSNIQFEMNKGNIFERQIDMDDEVLLTGGTQVDLYDLYLDTQKKLSSELSEANSRLEELTEKIEVSRQLFATQEKNALEQQQLIDQLSQEKTQLTDDLEELNTALADQEEKFDKRSKLFKNIYDGLLSAHGRIEGQNEKLRKGDEALVHLKNQLSEMDAELDDQTLDLIRKQVKIDQQRKIVIGLVLFSIVIVALVILLWLSQKQKKKKNQELQASLQEVKKMQKQLVESEKMASLGILTSGVSHEINNPLNYIKGGSAGLQDYLEKNKIDISELKLFFHAIDTGVERAAKIVSELNELGWEQEEGAMRWTQLSEIIDQSIKQIDELSTGEVEIKKVYEPKFLSLDANASKLKQAVHNILENAYQAINGQGSIFINAKILGKKVHLSITDTGCGISSKKLSRIMDPFYTTRGPGKGVGLGLSTAYAVIRAHNGSIQFESEEGKGTTVSLVLPVNQNTND